MNKPIPSTKVAVAILRQNGRVLVCQRKRGSRYELKWEFPGGKVEHGETILDCLQRELREELSIIATGVEQIETHTAFYEDGGWFEVSYCFVKAFEGTPSNNVFEDIRWVTPEELQRMDTLQGNATIIQKLALQQI